MTSPSSSLSQPSSPVKKRKRDFKHADPSDDSDSESDSDNASVDTSDDEQTRSDSEDSHISSRRSPKLRRKKSTIEISNDEPVSLSHAERRRQKKKERQSDSHPSKKLKLSDGASSPAPPDISSTPANTKSKASDSKEKDAKPKRQNSVWIGNLSFRTTSDDLRGFFDGVGDITRIHMPMKAGKSADNMGFAYVDFATPEGKVIAVTLSERDLHGRKLLIKDGNDFTGRPTKPLPFIPSTESTTPTDPTAIPNAQKTLSKFAQKTLRAQKQPPGPTLFFGNLGFETTENDLRMLVEMHLKGRGIRGANDVDDDDRGKGNKAKEAGGEGDETPQHVRKVRMGTFEDSGKCKGFAFIDFTSPQYATDALTNGCVHRLHGRDLVVEYASVEAVRRGGGAGGPKGAREGRLNKSERTGSYRDAAKGRGWNKNQEKGEEHIMDVDEQSHTVQRQRSSDHNVSARQGGNGRSSGGGKPDRRAKPGAALARAPRESAAIIPSQGQKIKF